MKRLQKSELDLYLVCPYCSEDLKIVEGKIVCFCCRERFGLFRGRPVLLSEKNVLFPASDYREEESGYDTMTGKDGKFQWLKKMVPKKSINLVRENMFHRLSREHGGKNKVILVVGCGNQTGQLEQFFPKKNTAFVFSDVDKHADADVFCDSHDLTFKDEIFDGVISTAVLEHVVYPERVVLEIYRVLKKDGFIYSEIPFLQSVHEGAYDFTRFTMSGHRRLLEFFEEIDAGMVAGPGTALVWSLVDFFKSMSCNTRISSGLGLGARSLFFWLKYFDYLVKNNPTALDAASCTYFYGKKADSRSTTAKIIHRYEGRKLEHI